MNMAQSLLYSLLAVLVPACTQPQFTGIFHVSDQFSDEEMAVMQAEASTLCSLTVGEHCPVLTRGESENVVVKAELPDGVLGHYFSPEDQWVQRITLAPGLSGSRLARVFRHELGHAAGCERHLPKGNVMAQYEQDQPESWSSEDVACFGEIDGF